MKTFFSLVSAAALLKVVLAGGSIDNSKEAASIRDASTTLSGDGTYHFKNVATGQQLSFRRDSVTNFFPSSDDGEPLELQFVDGAARISGGNNKCASAQWSYDVEGGVDAFAVSYACAVGDGQSGTDTLEKTKQWWYLVPAENSDDDDDEGDDGNDGDDDDDSSTKVGVSLAVKTSSKSEDKSSFSSTANKTVKATESTAEKFLDHSKGYFEYVESSIPLSKINSSHVDPKNRTTWECRHPGWWLARHPSYITKDGHVECKDDLAAYRAAKKSGMTRLARRSRSASHSSMSKKLVKRGSTNYFIIAQDHIEDMATRAFGSKSVDSFGGYTSTNLVLWDKSDKHQLWSVSEA